MSSLFLSRVVNKSGRMCRPLRAISTASAVHRLSAAAATGATHASSSSSLTSLTSSSLHNNNNNKKSYLITSGPNMLTNYPQTQLSVLPNGILVASEQVAGLNNVSLGVFIDAGSRYESDQTNGVAHFAEHIFFKGTKNRSRVQLEREIENQGAQLNAYTSRESTVFTARVMNQDVPWAVDLLSDIITRSNFNQDDIQHERDVILTEMQDVDSKMEEVIFDRLHETAYRGTALARTILGSEHQISSVIDRQMIMDYVTTHYTGNRMVISAAGAIDHMKLVDLVLKNFSHVPKTAPNGKLPVKTPAIFTGSDIRVRFDSMDKAHVALAFPIAGANDPDSIALQLIQTMLGNYEQGIIGAEYSSSRLISQCAVDNVASHVQSFITRYSDTGLFGVYAQAGKYRLNDLCYLITRELTEFCTDEDPDRLQEAKNTLKFQLLQNFESTAMISDDIGRSLLEYGRRMHPAEMIARIDAVDTKTIRDVANRYFWDSDFALAGIGPIYELPDYNWIRRRTYFLRY